MNVLLVALWLISQLGFGEDDHTQGEKFESLPVLSWEDIQEGDILFQNLDCGPLCDAIETVTQSAGGRAFSHCALVAKQEDVWGVIEAYGSVRFTPLDSFRQRPMAPGKAGAIILGRLKQPYRDLPPSATQEAAQYLGMPYDDVFLIDNQALYCSELVYEAYRMVNGGHPVFLLEPMEFKAPGDTPFMETWKTYYEGMSQPIPQGEPGINPGSLSRSPYLVLYEMESD